MLVLLALLIAPLAWSQEADREATPTEDAWLKLQLITEGDQSQIAEHMSSHGVGMQDIVKLKAYAESASRAITEAMQPKLIAICTDREQLADPIALADRMDKIAADEAALEAAAIAKLPSVVGEADVRAFNAFVASERKSRTVKGGGGDFVRAGTLAPETVFDRACKLKESPTASRLPSGQS